MKQVSHTRNEQAMLQAVSHPFIINLWGTFQDYTNLYMVMDFVPGGELFTLLRRSNVSTDCLFWDQYRGRPGWRCDENGLTMMYPLWNVGALSSISLRNWRSTNCITHQIVIL